MLKIQFSVVGITEYRNLPVDSYFTFHINKGRDQIANVFFKKSRYKYRGLDPTDPIRDIRYHGVPSRDKENTTVHQLVLVSSFASLDD